MFVKPDLSWPARLEFGLVERQRMQTERIPVSKRSDRREMG
jgi:hypothetical protein